MTGDAGYYGDQKVAYHNSGGPPGDDGYFRRLLTSLGNHLAAVGKERLEIRVVSFGPGLDLFAQAAADADLGGRLARLRGDGVRFLVCANTLRARDIGWPQLPGATAEDVVPSGVAELARLQGLGFSYIRF